MKIHPVTSELFHADVQTDRHEKANSHFSQFWERALKTTLLGTARYDYRHN